MRLRPSLILTSTVLLTVALALFFQGWVLMESRGRALDLVSLRAANRAQAKAHQVQGLFKQTDLLLLDLRGYLDPAEIQRGPGPASARRAPAVRDLFRAHMTEIPQLRASSSPFSTQRGWGTP